MRTRSVFVVLLLAVSGSLLIPADSSAVPVFARKYGFHCTMCHSSYPRLNDFGTGFRLNGYRLPGLETQEKTVLETHPPIALRTSGGYVGEFNNDASGMSDVSDFRLSGLDLLSAGVLGGKLGYMMVYVPPIEEARGLDGQEGTLEMASVVFSDLAGSWLNLRAGRFEPAYVSFSVKRQLSLSPYEIYEAAFPDGPVFSETQSGIEVSGHGRQRFRYAVGIVDGSATNNMDDTPSDVYVRLTQVIGRGEGQTTGQRIGAVGYMGQARPGAESEEVRARASFYRYGLDASLNAASLNLALQYLWARDDKSLWAAPERVDYSGGFAELTFLPREGLVGFARFDFINAPTIDARDVKRWTAGGRFYLEHNVALHLEYTYRQEESTTTADDATQSAVAARVDLAF
jgi:hypothetical protein